MDPFDLREWEGFQGLGGSLSHPAIVDQIVIDSRRIQSNKALFIALKGHFSDGHEFINQAVEAGATFVIVDKDFVIKDVPSQKYTLLRSDDPLKSFQEIAKAYRLRKKAKVIAITGSYGKTMCKDLLHSFLNEKFSTIASPESFNSQIGVPLSLLTIKDAHEIAIIEAAISKKGEMDRLKEMIKPDAVIFTHLGKKHLTTLGDLNELASEMMKLVEEAKDWALISDDDKLKPYVKNIKAPIHFWNHPDKELPLASIKSRHHHSKMDYEIQFPDQSVYRGKTNSGYSYFLDLIHITVKAAFLEGVRNQSITKVLDHFTLEPMRTELWQSQKGSIFINDIYCSDPQSIDQSLKYFNHSESTRTKKFIFSGMKGSQDHRDTDYKRIGKAISKANIDELILVGKYPYQPLIEEVKKNQPSTKITLQETMQEAIKKLQIEIKKEDVILLKGEKKESLDDLTESFDGGLSHNQCRINIAHIQSNLLAIRNKLPKKTRLMVMVKALAYGTSDIRMAKFLKSMDIDILGVSYVDEGVSLKEASVSQEIFVLNATSYEIQKILKWDLQVGVSHLEFIHELNHLASLQNKKVKVHLHVNTGMGRFGCRQEEALSLAIAIKESSHLDFEGIMTHFAAADDPKEDAFTLKQKDQFLKVIEEIESFGISIPWRHAANSSASIRFNFDEFNMVRIGLAVYGLYPSNNAEKQLDLRLSISLTSRIVGINECVLGDTISYGRSYKVTSDTQKIAVLPIGYYDGLHRNYSGKGYVIIRGKKAKMVGKICMDYMMVDVSDIDHVQIGDQVLIFGEDDYGNYLSPEEFAENGDSIIYELITCLGPRIQRVFIFEEALTFR